jgi:hypothetical protein
MTRSRKVLPPTATGVDVLETIKAEMIEGGELLRPHYPDDDEEQLSERVMSLLRDKYARGRWPTDEEIKIMKAQDTQEQPDAHDFN